MKTSIKSKADYQKELDNRVLFVADLMVGKTKKFKSYKEFWETIDFETTNMNQVVKGTRHFTVYNVFLLCEIHGISESWLVRGVGEAFGQANLAEKVQNLTDRLEKVEAKLGI